MGTRAVLEDLGINWCIWKSHYLEFMQHQNILPLPAWRPRCNPLDPILCSYEGSCSEGSCSLCFKLNRAHSLLLFHSVPVQCHRLKPLKKPTRAYQPSSKTTIVKVEVMFRTPCDLILQRSKYKATAVRRQDITLYRQRHSQIKRPRPKIGAMIQILSLRLSYAGKVACSILRRE